MRISPVLVTVLLLACGGEDETTSDSTFECTTERDGWEQCVDDTVQWCHALGDAHFHAGRNCAEDGLVCAAKNRVAYCADAAQSCEDGTPGRCEGAQAINCVEGITGFRRCGVGKACEVNDDGWAVCVEL